MADVFLSYKRSPTRRLIVRRLALILRAHEISVWWDTGLESGKEFPEELEREVHAAQVVVPLWCSMSVRSPWVLHEATIGRAKLLPMRLQDVSPPSAFMTIQACDLVGWDGSARNSNLSTFVEQVQRRFGRSIHSCADMVEELDRLPVVAALPPFDPVSNALLQQIRRAYLDQDGLIEFEDALALTLGSSIDDLIGGSTPKEQLDDLFRMLEEGANEHLIFDENDHCLIEEKDFSTIRTIGDLVLLLRSRREG